jgi:hypothetical protein
VRSIGRRRDWAPTEPPRRRYVASLIWPATLAAPANDNRAPACGKGFGVSLALGALLLAATVWGMCGFS